MNQFYYKHYVTFPPVEVGKIATILDGFSTAFKQPKFFDRCINEQGGYQFKIMPDSEENTPLIDRDGCHLYRWDNEQVRKATQEELDQEFNELQNKNLDSIKSNKISQSKKLLAKYLEFNPLTYTDGKQYSVTAEKQNLLTSALTRYQLAQSAGITADLKWNATGEECIVWEYNNLASLALAIAAYVEPLVAKQQNIEISINACTTVDEVNNIVIEYGV